jgi:SAM-dependent methyltransferase
MSDDLASARREVRSRLLDADRLVSASAAGSLRGQKPRWRRVELRPVELKAQTHLQVVTFDERQSFTANHESGSDSVRVIDELLAEPFGHWHVASTEAEYGFRVTKGGRVLVTRAESGRTRDVRHDRQKNRMVDPAAPFLRELGVSDAAGKVKKGKTDKYRQVEEFVRVLDASVRESSEAGRLRGDRLGGDRLRVIDLGCGNAYLTFAMYHHLHDVMRRQVEVIGVDVKREARRHNTAVADRLRWSDDVRFIEGEIGAVRVDVPVDITVALHACDTATDDALARGVAWRSDLIVAAPCCHHDLQRQLRGAKVPAPYDLVARHGLMRERWADLLTDSLRVHLLRRSGYRADIVEFVDSAHTPRNALIRAHRTDVGATAAQEADYSELITSWGVRPKLETLLDEQSSGAEGE